MREMVSRSSFSWDQAGMTQRTASHVISTGATDFFFVVNIFVVNIAEPPHLRTKNSENGGLYTAPNFVFAVPPGGFLWVFLGIFSGTRSRLPRRMWGLHCHLRSRRCMET